MAKGSIRWPDGMISCKWPIHALPLPIGELNASQTGSFAAELVREQHRMMRADLLVFVFPLWWGTRARFAHREAEAGRRIERHNSAIDQGGPAMRCKPKAEGSEWP